MSSSAENGPFAILRSGRVANLGAREGCHAFLAESPDDFITWCIRIIEPRREQVATNGDLAMMNGRLAVKDILHQYIILRACVKIPTDEVFFSRISANQRELFAEHVQEVLSALCLDSGKKNQWHTSGKLAEYDEIMLKTLVSLLCRDPVLTKRLRKLKIFHSLAKLLEAARDHTPSRMPQLDAIHSITEFVATAIWADMKIQHDSMSSKLHRQFHYSGLWSQLLRIFSHPKLLDVPERCPSITEGLRQRRISRIKFFVFTILDQFTKHPRRVHEYCKEGQPLRKTIDETLSYCPIEISYRLMALKRLVHLCECYRELRTMECCWNCNKHIVRHLKCSKCWLAMYCDKDCQRAHWKVHKKSCQEDKVRDRNCTIQELIFQAFLTENMFEIMAKLAILSLDANAPRRDLLLEVDFSNHSWLDLPAPALRTPSEFMVTTYQNYLEHVRKLGKSWFSSEAMKESFCNSLARLREDDVGRDDAILYCVRFPDDYYMCRELSAQPILSEGLPPYSDLSLLAMHRALHEEDDGGLERVFSPNDIKRFQIWKTCAFRQMCTADIERFLKKDRSFVCVESNNPSRGCLVFVAAVLVVVWIVSRASGLISSSGDDVGL